MRGVKAAATAAAVVAVLLVVGVGSYVTTRDEAPPPTTTTTTTVRPPTPEEVVAAVTAALSRGLEVPLDGVEAACVSDGLLTDVGVERLEAIASFGGDADDLTAVERGALVRAVVLCVPPEKAAAMLSTQAPPSTIAGLPDEGVGG